MNKRPPIKLNIPQSKRPDRRRPPASDSPVTNDLAAKLVKLHREHAGIGPLLFGIKYHQEIADCPDPLATLVKLADVGDYVSDINKGMRLAAHVVAR